MADSQQPTLFAEEDIVEKSTGSDTVTGNSRSKRPKKAK